MDKNLEFTTKPVLSLHCGYRRCQAGLGACTLQSVASTQLGGGGEMNLASEVTLARVLFLFTQHYGDGAVIARL